MRVLCSCVPGHGHFHPLIPIATSLAAAGHQISFVVDETFRPEVMKAGFDVIVAGEDIASPMFRAVGEHPEFFELSPLAKREFAMREVFGGARMDSSFEAILAAARGFEPDVIIHDPAEYAAPLIAAIEAIPNVCVGYGMVLQRSLRVAAGRAVAHWWQTYGLEAPDDGGPYRYMYLDPCPGSLQGPGLAEVVTAAAIRPIAFGDSTEDGLPDAVGALGDRPLVYVTLGTLYSGDTPALRSIVQGLQPLGVNIVVTVGPNGDPTAVEPAPNIVVERFIPQRALLPRCAMIVTHGGSGSMLGPLAEGIPILATPRGADQFENADAIVRSGAGIAVQPSELTVEGVTHAARRVLEDPSFRAAAQRVATEISGMPHPDTLVGRIEDLVASGVAQRSV